MALTVTRDPVGRYPWGPNPSFGVGHVAGNPRFPHDFQTSAFPGTIFNTNGESSHYKQNGEPRVTFAYTISLKRDGASLPDLGHSQLLFSEAHEIAQRYTPGVSSVKTLSALNHYLSSPEGRALGGVMEIMKRWRLIGVQQTDLNVGRHKIERSAAITVFTAHRAMTPNIWALQGGVVRPGDHLWLILRQEVVSGQDTGADAIAEMKNGPSGDKTSTKVWRYVPYVTRDGTPPPSSELNTPDTRDTFGARIYVGFVRMVKGPQKNMRGVGYRPSSRQQLTTAEMCCFPVKLDDAHHDRINRLNQLEVFLRVK